MSEYLSSKIRPFTFQPDEFVTDEEKASAIDFKDFSKKFKVMENEQIMNQTLSNAVFFTVMIKSKRYYRYIPDSKF